jgi:hypothetical protein
MSSTNKPYADKLYEVYGTKADGSPGAFEATYDTVAEVLAHCEEQAKTYAIKVDGAFLDLDTFMERHVAAG